MLLSTRDHGGVWFRFIAGCSGSDLKGDSPDPDPGTDLSGPPGSSRQDRPGCPLPSSSGNRGIQWLGVSRFSFEFG